MYNDRYAAYGPGRYINLSLLQSRFDEGWLRAIDFNGDSSFSKSFTSHEQVHELVQIYSRRPYSFLLRSMKRMRTRLLITPSLVVDSRAMQGKVA